MARWAVLPLVLALVAGAAQAQTLDLVGPGGVHAQLDAPRFARLPHVTVTVADHGKARTYAGVLLADLVSGVGAPRGEAIKGPERATVIRVTGADGYQVALALLETDPLTRKGRVIVADREAGRPLTPADGPFRLVVEDDLRPARSVRQVELIEVLRLAAP